MKTNKFYRDITISNVTLAKCLSLADDETQRLAKLLNKTKNDEAAYRIEQGYNKMKLVYDELNSLIDLYKEV